MKFCVCLWTPLPLRWCKLLLDPVSSTGDFQPPPPPKRKTSLAGTSGSANPCDINMCPMLTSTPGKIWELVWIWFGNLFTFRRIEKLHSRQWRSLSSDMVASFRPCLISHHSWNQFLPACDWKLEIVLMNLIWAFFLITLCYFFKLRNSLLIPALQISAQVGFHVGQKAFDCLESV